MNRQEIIRGTYHLQWFLFAAIVASLVGLEWSVNTEATFWVWISAAVTIANGALFLWCGSIREKLRGP